MLEQKEKDTEQIKIVKCTECKFLGLFGMCTFNGRMEIVNADDFCSKGELNEHNT